MRSPPTWRKQKPRRPDPSAPVSSCRWVTTIGGAAVCAGISSSLCSALGNVGPCWLSPCAAGGGLWRKAGICQKGSVAVAAARWEHPDIVMVPALLALADIVHKRSSIHRGTRGRRGRESCRLLPRLHVPAAEGIAYKSPEITLAERAVSSSPRQSSGRSWTCWSSSIPVRFVFERPND